MTETTTANAPHRSFRDGDDRHERDLVARVRSGDAGTFDEIVAGHQERITWLVHRLLGWSGEVEDVVQNVFLRVLEKLHGFRGESSLSTWLTTIAVNECRAHRRRNRLRLRKLFRLWQARRGRCEGEPQPDQIETHAEVRRAVRALPHNYREPIVLRYFEELSIAEIAEILGLSINAVEVRLARARRKLKESLSNHIEMEPT